MCELPFNYAMADGLLYISRAKEEPDRHRWRHIDRIFATAIISALMGMVMKAATLSERVTGKVSDFGPLFEYTVKLVLLTSFLELVLYRLVSRLGMHLSKLAADHRGSHPPSPP